jgi:hypothetical protein
MVRIELRWSDKLTERGVIRKKRSVTLLQTHSSKAMQGLLSYSAHLKGEADRTEPKPRRCSAHRLQKPQTR